MEARTLLADICRQFLQDKKIRQYRTKRITEMTHEEVIASCHWYCEENSLISEWESYRMEMEAQYRYCTYLEEYIDDGYCYDLQMISSGCIKPSALPDIRIDKEQCLMNCSKCEYSL